MAAAVAALVLVGAGATFGALLSDGDSPDRSAAQDISPSTPSVEQPSSAPATRVSPEQTSETPGQSTSAGDGSLPDTVSLTTLEPAGEGQFAWFEVGTGSLDAKRYTTALVPDGYNKNPQCAGSAEYNLSREWSTLTLVAGVSDNSEHDEARLTISVDGTARHTGTVALGTPEVLTLNIKNGLRLSIEYADPADRCEMGDLVLAEPTLKR